MEVQVERGQSIDQLGENNCHRLCDPGVDLIIRLNVDNHLNPLHTASKGPENLKPALYKVSPVRVDPATYSTLLSSCHSERSAISSPHPQFRRSLPPSPEHEAKSTVQPERKRPKPKLMVTGNRPIPSASRRRLLQLLHRPKKVTAVLSGKIANLAALICSTYCC